MAFASYRSSKWRRAIWWYRGCSTGTRGITHVRQIIQVSNVHCATLPTRLSLAARRILLAFYLLYCAPATRKCVHAYVNTFDWLRDAHMSDSCVDAVAHYASIIALGIFINKNYAVSSRCREYLGCFSYNFVCSSTLICLITTCRFW